MGKRRWGRKKIPKLGVKDRAKDPRSHTPSTDGDFISWKFGSVDPDGPFGWRACDQGLLWGTVKDRIANIETMTWMELMRNGESHGLAEETLSHEAERRLYEIEQDDNASSLFSLRVTARMRIIGIRDRQFLKILWWDPDHQVCPSTKKS